VALQDFNNVAGLGATTERGVISVDAAGAVFLQENQTGTTTITSTDARIAVDTLSVVTASADSDTAVRLFVGRDDTGVTTPAGPVTALPTVVDVLRFGGAYTTLVGASSIRLYAVYLAPGGLTDVELDEAWDYIDQRFPHAVPRFWTPADDSPAVWLDFKDAGNVLLSGAEVLGAYDLSGNGRDADVVGTGTLVRSASLNGNQAVVYDGASSRALRIPAHSYQAMMWIGDAALIATNPSWQALASDTAAGYIGVVESGNAIDPISQDVTYVSARVNDTLIDPLTRDSFHTSVEGEAIIQLQWFVLDLDVWGDVRLFTNTGDSAFYFEGAVGEVFLFDIVPTKETRERYSGYVAHRWGKTALLDAAHPHKTYRPLNYAAVPEWYAPLMAYDPVYCFVGDTEFVRNDVDGRVQATVGSSVASLANAGSAAARGIQATGGSQPDLVVKAGLLGDATDNTMAFEGAAFENLLASRFFTAVVHYFDMTVGTNQTPLSLGAQDNDADLGAQLFITAGGELNFLVSDPVVETRLPHIIGTAAVEQTIAVALNGVGGKVRGYINGVGVSEENIPAETPTSGALSYLPSLLSAGGTRFFNGSVRYAAVYDRPLTPEEIARLTGLAPPEEAFGTVLALGPSANFFGTEDARSMAAVIGTDNIVACTNTTASTYGVKCIDPAMTELWQWTNGGASPTYSEVSGGVSFISRPGGTVLNFGRTASAKPYVVELGTDGVPVWFSDVYTLSGNRATGSVSGAALSEVDGRLIVRCQGNTPNTDLVDMDPTTGAFLSRQNFNGTFTSGIFYGSTAVPGLIIRATTTGNVLTAFDKDTLATVWEVQVGLGSTTITTPSSNGVTAGSMVARSPDGSVIYLTRGTNGLQTGSPYLNAFDAVTGVELWEIDLNSVDYCNAVSIGLDYGCLAVDRHGDIYVLARVTNTRGIVNRIRPDGTKVYSSAADLGVEFTLSTSTKGMCVSHTSGIIYASDADGNIHTMTQSY
jgi:hypothetical protein